MSGCGPKHEIELQGTVTGLKPTAQGGVVVINGTFNGSGTPDVVHLVIGAKTRISDQRPGQDGSKQVALASLRPGQTVAARITGGVRESYPLQADASHVSITN
jgi:hypothetical protein